MKIVSNELRLLDELFDELDIMGIDVQKVELNNSDLADERPMGFLETTALVVTIAVGITKLYDFFEKNLPKWKIWFQTDKVKMSYEEYMAMSDNAKKAISSKLTVVIKRRCD